MQPHTTPGPLRFTLATLLGLAVAAIMGGLVALLSASHHWGIASLVILAALGYFIVQANKRVLRVARVSRYATAMRIAMPMMVVYLLAETWVTAALMHTDLVGFYASRWTTGLTLFGAGSWAIKSWLWVVPYALRLFLIYILFMGAAADEGDRPFCTSCNTATTNLIWKQVVGRFHAQRLADFAKLGGQWNFGQLLTTIHRDEAGDQGIYIRVWSCDCGDRFEFRAESSRIGSVSPGGTELVGYFPMQAPSLAKVVQWVRTVDPAAPIPEPILKLCKGH